MLDPVTYPEEEALRLFNSRKAKGLIARASIVTALLSVTAGVAPAMAAEFATWDPTGPVKIQGIVTLTSLSNPGKQVPCDVSWTGYASGSAWIMTGPAVTSLCGWQVKWDAAPSKDAGNYLLNFFTASTAYNSPFGLWYQPATTPKRAQVTNPVGAQPMKVTFTDYALTPSHIRVNGTLIATTASGGLVSLK